jgi:hypothetical protein
MGGAVDWGLIAKAISHYQQLGYVYVEAPWVVPTEVLMATCPHERYLIQSTLGGLVGSAEQSFIHLRKNQGLPPGKYVACTPCFRNEDVVDHLHQKTFMKVELYETSPKTDIGIFAIMHDALGFFERIIPAEKHHALKAVLTTALSFDIELGGIEIGSYGFRSHEGIEWLYGTGLAEPRFSTALSLVDDYHP